MDKVSAKAVFAAAGLPVARGRVVDADAAEGRRAVELLRARYPQQVAVGAVLAVDVDRWSGWAARSPARSIRARGS